MEAQATAQARRAVNLRQGPRQYRSIQPPQPTPSYSPSPPPGLTSRGRLQKARPPLGRPSRQDSTLHPARADPTVLKQTEPLRKPPETLKRTAFWEM